MTSSLLQCSTIITKRNNCDFLFASMHGQCYKGKLKWLPVCFNERPLLQNEIIVISCCLQYKAIIAKGHFSDFMCAFMCSHYYKEKQFWLPICSKCMTIIAKASTFDFLFASMHAHYYKGKPLWLPVCFNVMQLVQRETIVTSYLLQFTAIIAKASTFLFLFSSMQDQAYRGGLVSSCLLQCTAIITKIDKCDFLFA